MATSDRAKELKDILELLNREGKYAKREDIARFFGELVTYIKNLEPKLKKHLDENLHPELKKRVERELEDATGEIRETMKKLRRGLEDDMGGHKQGVRDDFSTLSDGIDELCRHLGEVVSGLPREEDVIRLIEEHRQEQEESMTAEEIRDHLELLIEDERLDGRTAIKGFAELEEAVAALGRRGNVVQQAAGYGVDVFVDGVDQGITKYVNLIGGVGTDISVNRVGERMDVTITATGGGGLTILPVVSGAINDSNTTFTFASEPSLVVINGAPYRNGKGVTITGTSVETEYPVGTGGDIYALG